MKTLTLAFLAFFTVVAQAQIADHRGVTANLEIISDLLTDARTPAQAKALLATVINGQRGDEVVAILDVKKTRNNVFLEVVITIGVDDVTDNDSGWSAVYEIRAKYYSTFGARAPGEVWYQLSSVELVPTAG